jgi:hypothetical protein
VDVVVRKSIDGVHGLGHQIPMVGKSGISLNDSQASRSQILFALVQRGQIVGYRHYVSAARNQALSCTTLGVQSRSVDARAYMLRLSKDRERSTRWQRAAQLLLAKSDVGAISRQLELALLYDGKLDVAQ